MTEPTPGASDQPPPEVRLRDVEEADLPVFFEHQRDPEACRLAAFAPRDREAFDAHWARILGDDRVVAKTILAGGVVAGNVGSWGPPSDRLVGYWVGQDLWGRGIATRALTAFLSHEDVRPLRAIVARHNVGSIRVLEKCGFVVVTERVAEDGVEELLMELPGGAR